MGGKQFVVELDQGSDAAGVTVHCYDPTDGATDRQPLKTIHTTVRLDAGVIEAFNEQSTGRSAAGVRAWSLPTLTANLWQKSRSLPRSEAQDYRRICHQIWDEMQASRDAIVRAMNQERAYTIRWYSDTGCGWGQIGRTGDPLKPVFYVNHERARDYTPSEGEKRALNEASELIQRNAPGDAEAALTTLRGAFYIAFVEGSAE